MNKDELRKLAQGDDVIPLYHAALDLLEERDDWRKRYQQAILDWADDVKRLSAVEASENRLQS